MGYKIAIIEDDLGIAKGLERLLSGYGYNCTVIKQFETIDKEVKELQPHLILLDINLPYFNGFYWCQKIRNFNNCPIVVISAREGAMDLVVALDNGADDYITKPFDNDVVVAKVKSHIRRSYGDYVKEEKELQINGLVLQMDKLMLCFADTKLALSAKEQILLHELMLKHGEVVRREVLLEKVWDDESFVDGNTLNVNITRIRRKLEELGLINVLTTVRRVGYQLSIE